MGAIARLLGTLHQILPPWAYAVLVVVLLAAAGPAFLYRLRSRQIRTAVRNVARATTLEARRDAEDDAFWLTGDRARLLAALGEEALRLNQGGLLERVKVRLTHLGGHEGILRSFETRDAPPKPGHRHPLEAVVAVERLLDAKLVDRAHERLAEARVRFPNDPDLLALDTKVREARAQTQSDGSAPAAR
jgi:hypothetical protein